MNVGETSDSSYKTAADIMMTYINNCNYESAYLLLKEGEINLEIKNSIGMTPLLQAVKNDNLTFVNLLLDMGADPNCRKEFKAGWETPLIVASQNNYFEIAKLLLDFGADPTSKDSSGLACLHYAARNGCLEICLLLISRGCDPLIRDDMGNNAGFWAKRNNHNDLLPYLPPAATITPLDNKEYRDNVDEFKFLINAEDKKKMSKGKKGGKGKKKK
jgi:ankyrin repeat protein